MSQLDHLIEKRNSMVSNLNKYKHILRGTIIKRGNICGKANCRCKRNNNPVLHGPYRYLSHRSRERTNMIFLNKKKFKYANQGIKEYQELIKLIYQISEVNFEILRYHHNRLGDRVE